MFDSFISFLSDNNIGKNAIKAILLAGSLSFIVRISGFTKESTIAYYFGESKNFDFYMLALAFLIFFVQPIGGAIKEVYFILISDSNFLESKVIGGEEPKTILASEENTK